MLFEKLSRSDIPAWARFFAVFVVFLVAGISLPRRLAAIRQMRKLYNKGKGFSDSFNSSFANRPSQQMGSVALSSTALRMS